MKASFIRAFIQLTPPLLFLNPLPAADKIPGPDATTTVTRAAASKLNSVRASELLGRDVRSGKNQPLATIENFLIDLSNGRVVQVVIAGPTLGEGRVEVPARVFAFDPKERVLRWPEDSVRLAQSPRYNPPGSNRHGQVQHAAEVYRYYGEQPYFRIEADSELATSKGEPRALGRVELASDLIGTNILNAEGKKVGELKDFILDVKAGRVIAVIIGAGGFLGIGEGSNGVPPSVLTYVSDDRRDLTFIASKESLRKAPRFKAGEEDRFNEPGYTDDLYRAYEQTPYTQAVAADNTRANRQDRQDGGLTPLDHGTAATDVELTARIRKAIIAHGDFSINAQNVKIITRDQHVTLRRPVKSDHEKQLIGEIALRETGSSGRVGNQLTITGD